MSPTCPPGPDGFAPIQYALQPIVNLHTGLCMGVEALIRGVALLGFASIDAFFDHLHRQGILFEADLLLRQKALTTFTSIPFHQQLRLFYNLDNRILCAPGYRPGLTQEILKPLGLQNHNLCFEISEKHDIQERGGTVVLELTRRYRRQGFHMAIDDFGVGHSGLRLLYELETDLIKIDRFFIDGMAQDRRKRLFVEQVTRLCHLLGMKVIAEGLEREEDFLVCRDLGVDGVQGFLLGAPTLQPKEIPLHAPTFDHLRRRDRRMSLQRSPLSFRQQVTYIPPIAQDLQELAPILAAFRHPPYHTSIPVLDAQERPVGTLQERDFKQYIYSPYGTRLLENMMSRGTWRQFIRPTPVIASDDTLDHALKVFGQSPDTEGLLVTENGTYRGMLKATALLRHLQNRNLARARDQNPLTRLPGNLEIDRHLCDMLAGRAENPLLVYFDFNHFKPFNDRYGFRQGDRAIQLFADLLREKAREKGYFVGHVGGDDFVMSSRERPTAEVLADTRALVDRFGDHALPLHSEEHRARGSVRCRGRQGEDLDLPLLSLSACVLSLPAASGLQPDTVVSWAAKGKKMAKARPDHLYFLHLKGTEEGRWTEQTVLPPQKADDTRSDPDTSPPASPERGGLPPVGPEPAARPTPTRQNSGRA